MPALNQNIATWAGDTIDIVFTVKAADGNDLPLIGATVRWWAGKKATSVAPDVYVKKESPVGITVAGSTCTCRLSSGDTTNAMAGANYHEADVTFPDGRSYTVLCGTMTIHPTLTN